MKFYQDNYSTVFCGDARAVLKQLPEASVDMCMTSPPYYGLRKYLCEPSIWDGDENCQHEWGDSKLNAFTSHHHAGETNPGKTGYVKDAGGYADSSGQFCLKCHAWRGVLGMEPSPDCGRPNAILRKDLNPKQREYVVKELKRLGLI